MIHQHDVGLQFARQADRLFAVRRLTHKLEIGHGAQYGTDTLPHKADVFSQKHPD